ncbi:MAG TPA: hypothetical protein VED17_10260 [Nitrososphaerales archaeon]|nr:hypothetical protein [Nitrososphaerales archaeon]
MPSSSNVAILAFVPLIVISLALGIYLSTSVGPSNQTTTTAMNYVYFAGTTETSNSTLGLQLRLSLNSTLIGPGQFISATIADYNIFPNSNNVSAAKGWRLRYLTLGSCGTLNDPFGVAFFQGYYTSSNISLATPLSLEKEGVVINCPMIANVLYYVFQPMSDDGSIFAASGNGSASQLTPGQPSAINGTVSFGTYWDSSNIQHNLGPGVYTVAGGDEWGQFLILHFAVISTLPLRVVSITGPIPPYNPGGPVVSIAVKNTANLPITFLNATLEVPSAEPSVSYSFNFGINSSNPLLQNQTVQSARTLIGAGFDNSVSYPIVISGSFYNGVSFNFTEQVMIAQPS